jgi:hypothetical protein
MKEHVVAHIHVLKLITLYWYSGLELQDICQYPWTLPPIHWLLPLSTFVTPKADQILTVGPSEKNLLQLSDC